MPPFMTAREAAFDCTSNGYFPHGITAIEARMYLTRSTAAKLAKAETTAKATLDHAIGNERSARAVYKAIKEVVSGDELLAEAAEAAELVDASAAALADTTASAAAATAAHAKISTTAAAFAALAERYEVAVGARSYAAIQATLEAASPGH